MPSTIISDTTCIIILDKIGQLQILRKLFGTILITETIASEFGQPLPDWFQIRQPSDKIHQEILQPSLGAGEASAVALALDMSDCLLITDDWKARRLATKLGIRLSGTLAVLLDAKKNGHVVAIKPLIERMRTAKFRMSEELIAKVLRLADENDH